ncbi:hypothetical protein Bpfe_007320 [Biomphalaria pfeifferi]|uniref:Uncharacterized protein n=1 Tax=Biomphalaria pfeifferi TaxID=112525 RepID=A0AAD8FHA3_BIOPF|nr:hypothetical protein Bpfe_007320 [Biomphalaria pfeifferi]
MAFFNWNITNKSFTSLVGINVLLMLLLINYNFTSLTAVRPSFVRLHSYKHQLSQTTCSVQLEAERDYAVLVGTVGVISDGKNPVAVLSCLNTSSNYIYTACKIQLDVRQCIVLVYYTGCYCETANADVLGVVMSIKVHLDYFNSPFMLSYFPNYPNLSFDDAHSNVIYLPQIIDPEIDNCYPV